MGHAIGRWYRQYFRMNCSGGINLKGRNRYGGTCDLDPGRASQNIQPSKQNVPDFTVMGRIARTGSSPEKLFTIKIARAYRDWNSTNGLCNIPHICPGYLEIR